MTLTKPPNSNLGEHLLSLAHPDNPETSSALFTEKIIRKPLLLTPTSAASTEDDRSRRRLARLRKKAHFLQHQKPRPLSAKQKRILGVYDIPKHEAKYEILKRLHKMWVGYLQEVLGLKGENGSATQVVTAQVHGSSIASADLHGAEVEVVRSGKCVDRVGIRGIVIRETRGVLVLVTKKDKVKTIPKEQTVFRLEIPFPNDQADEGQGDTVEQGEEAKQKEAETETTSKRKPLIFELHGSQFLNRPADRANKKFKWRPMEYL